MTVKWQIMQGIAGVALFAIAVAIEPREISDQVFLAQRASDPRCVHSWNGERPVERR